MKRKLHSLEQIVKKLREVDAALTSGSTVEQRNSLLESAVDVYKRSKALPIL